MLDTLNLINTASKSLHSELPMDTLTERQFSQTCVSLYSPVQLSNTEELRMWLLEAFPASHFQLPERKPEPMTKEICGPQQPTLFALCDLPAFYWKTYQECLDSTTQNQSSLTLPKWGMWDIMGLYPQPMLEQDTSENDCGLLEREPDGVNFHHTPNTSGMDGESNSRRALVKRQANWPSPTCSDVYTGNLKSTQQKPGSMHSVTLPQAVAMWPTPDSNMGARGTQPEWKPVRDSGHTATYTINQAVRDYWMTPTVFDSRDARRSDAGKEKRVSDGYSLESNLNEQVLSCSDNVKALNPDWVEFLMGWPVGWSDIKPLAELNWRDWKTDPADTGEVPRVTDVKLNRANRLKAIGNGQVPQCVVKAWELLS